MTKRELSRQPGDLAGDPCSGPGNLSPSWQHFYRRALPAYWIFVACATHFPGLKLPGAGFSPDKLAHFAAFGLLALLFWRFAQSFGRPLTGRFVWFALVILGGYAAIDEYTQGFVGRRVDITDWLLGLAGIVPVLGVLEWRRRLHQAR